MSPGSTLCEVHSCFAISVRNTLWRPKCSVWMLCRQDILWILTPPLLLEALCFSLGLSQLGSHPSEMDCVAQTLLHAIDGILSLVDILVWSPFKQPLQLDQECQLQIHESSNFTTWFRESPLSAHELEFYTSPIYRSIQLLWIVFQYKLV